jgi:hypothetical protein
MKSNKPEPVPTASLPLMGRYRLRGDGSPDARVFSCPDTSARPTQQPDLPDHVLPAGSAGLSMLASRPMFVRLGAAVPGRPAGARHQTPFPQALFPLAWPKPIPYKADGF